MGYPIRNWPPYSPDLNPIENVWAILKEIFTDKKARHDKVFIFIKNKLKINWPNKCHEDSKQL